MNQRCHRCSYKCLATLLWNLSFLARNQCALSAPSYSSKCPARRGQPAPLRLEHLREGICSSVEENLSKLAVRFNALMARQKATCPLRLRMNGPRALGG